MTIGNPGIGWSIAWKRWVLVVIGTTLYNIDLVRNPNAYLPFFQVVERHSL